MRSTTGGQHNFAEVPRADIQRSSFDRSCGHKTTFDAGYLVPIFCDEALPGDTMSLKMAAFARFATPLKPILDNVKFDVHFWSVPNRLLWVNWKKFNGEQNNPGDSTEYTIPQCLSIAGCPEGGISDHMGIPPSIPMTSVSAFWHRAYGCIWNEWYRDENLIASGAFPTDDGPDIEDFYILQRRGKRHDYFTSALPWPQKGPAVTIPFTENARVISDTSTLGGDGIPHFEIGTTRVDATLASINAQASAEWDKLGVGNSDARWTTDDGGSWTGLEADLSAVTATTINIIRQAFQIQRLYERDARGGSRYTEILKSHFGVTSPDSRQQRPEFLGGGTFDMNIIPVPKTTGHDSDPVPQGNLAGFGTGSGNGIGFTKSFTEHCTIIGIVSARADLNYQQGIDRMWSRKSRWDFFWPALAHLGEQSILNQEIYYQGPAVVNGDGDPVDLDVFGYQERYGEMRYKPSLVTGKFRSSDPQSLDYWHLAQEFGSLPTLGGTFIEEAPPIDRVIAVPGEPHFLLDTFFKFKHTRPMPTYGVPGQMDHF